MRKVLSALAAVAGMATALPATAGTYEVSYMAGGQTADLLLSVADIQDPCCTGGYDILGVSGNLGPDAVTGLVATSSPGVVTSAPVGANPILFDNVFYTSPPNFDIYGLLFTTASDYYNIYNESGQYYQLTPEQKDAGSLGDIVTSLTVTAVPEPESWGFLAFGLAIISFLAARRKSRHAPV
jgi:hypothetical protein